MEPHFPAGVALIPRQSRRAFGIASLNYVEAQAERTLGARINHRPECRSLSYASVCKIEQRRKMKVSRSDVRARASSP
jgi:hypothetical protein